MSATADQANGRGLAQRLGVEPGAVVAELGNDDDIDQELRQQVRERCGHDLAGEDSDEVVDIVLLWWRDDDGDLTDRLVDAIAPLADNGVVWLLTPKVGRLGHVEPSEITESASIAGLSQTSSISAGKDWAGARLVAPKAARSRR